jgi:acyl-CoA synthetase (AMP-forming)/AMP-acid ligase II
MHTKRILQQTLLLREDESGDRAVLASMLRKKNLTFADFAAVWESNSPAVLRRMVSSGQGVCFAYASAMQDEAAVPVPLGEFSDERTLVFLCRKDSQIKHMGHRIELGEIESAANKCDGVRSSCCVYDNEAKRIVLFFVGEAQKDALLRELAVYLPRYMLPAHIEKLDALPFTANGKIDTIPEMMDSLGGMGDDTEFSVASDQDIDNMMSRVLGS